MTSCQILADRHDFWVGCGEQQARKLRLRRMVNRVGDNHQIFPEDAHRVASADHGVNAYSVNFLTYWMH